MADILDNEEDAYNGREVDRNAFISGIDTLEVDNIIATRVEKGYRQYLVCFKSWLSEEYLDDYRKLIQEFWKNSETDNKGDDKFGQIEHHNENRQIEHHNENRQSEEIITNANTNNGYHDGDDEGDDNDDDEEQKQENGFATEFEGNGRSEESLVWSAKSSNAPLCKKRKLKSLDDIVRKITKTSDTSESKEGGDELKLSDRLQTLDETLRENEVEGKKGIHHNNLEGALKICVKEEVNGSEEHNEIQSSKSNHIDEKGSQNKNGCMENVYWSAGKAYHRTKTISEHEHSRQIDQFEVSKQQTDLPTKSRQRYHKCRFCATLYSDPILLERHESSHFEYSRECDVRFLQNSISPPPLVPVSNDFKAFTKYPYDERNMHNAERRHSPPTSPSSNNKMHHSYQENGQSNESEDESIVRKPIRNLLTKMYESEKRQNLGDDEIQKSSEQEIECAQEPSKQTTDDICPSPEYHKEMSRNQLPIKNRPTPHSQIKQADSDQSKRCDEKTEESFQKLALECSACQETFEHKDGLEQHIVRQHEPEKFVCSVCSEIFVDKDVYNAHCLLHLDQNYVCGFCKKIYDCHNAYQNHLQSHSQDQPFCCHICRRAFSLRTELRRHLLIHANATPFYCHICGKGFQRSDILRQHIKSAHSNGSRKNSDGFENKNVMQDGHLRGVLYHEDGNQTDTHDHKSPREMEHSPSRSSSASHDSSEQQRYEPIKMTRYYKEANMYPYKPLSNRHLNTSPRSHDLLHHPHPHHHRNNAMVHHHPNIRKMSPNEPYNTNHRMAALMADQCSYNPIKPNPVKILPRPNTAQHHPSFECLKCGERFSSPSLYDIHVQSHKEVFECEKCHKSFTSRNQYDSHIHTHDNNKSHKCPYCHRSFSMKGNLRRHIRIHTNEAPYECPICYQRFRRSDGLKGHIKRHETLGESAPTDLLPSQAS